MGQEWKKEGKKKEKREWKKEGKKRRKYTADTARYNTVGVYLQLQHGLRGQRAVWGVPSMHDEYQAYMRSTKHVWEVPSIHGESVG